MIYVFCGFLNLNEFLNLCVKIFFCFMLTFVCSISGSYFATYAEKQMAIKRAFESCGGSKLREDYSPIYANAVLYMVAEFEDGTIEVVPENWAYRPTRGSGDKPSVAIPESLDKVRYNCAVFKKILNLRSLNFLPFAN